MTTLKIGFMAALIALAAAPLSAKGALKDLPIDRNFLEREITWTNASGGMDIMWAMIRMEGKLWVCGAVRHKDTRTFLANRAVLRKGWVKRGSLKGKKVMTDLSYFKELKPRKSFDGAMSTCRDTGLKPDNSQYHLNFDPHMTRI